MRAVLRILREGVAVLSSVFLVVTVAFWVRRRYRIDEFGPGPRVWRGPASTRPLRHYLTVLSDGGVVEFTHGVDYYLRPREGDGRWHISTRRRLESEDPLKRFIIARPTPWQRAGFCYHHVPLPSPDELGGLLGAGETGLAVPHWAIALAFLPVPVVRVRRALGGGRARRRARAGLCPACGYDCRATPGRCPECGKVADV